MATGLESLVQTQPSPAVEEKEEEGFIDKTMDVAGDVIVCVVGLVHIDGVARRLREDTIS